VQFPGIFNYQFLLTVIWEILYIQERLLMKINTFHLANLVVIIALLFSCGSGVLAGIQPAQAAVSAPALVQAAGSENQAVLAQDFGKMPLLFIQNQGQTDQQVAFYLQGQDSTIYFTSSGLTFALSEALADTGTTDASLSSDADPKRQRTSPAESRRWALKLDFVGANPGVIPQGEEKAEAIVSYFTGSQDQWHTGLPTFQRLVYHNLWPGIDLIYFGSGSQLKYEFLVEPGADPADIRLAYRGASSLKLDEAGNMQVTTPYRIFQDDAPTAYQVVGEAQKSVTAAYRVQGAAVEAAAAARNVVSYSFQLGAYDASLPLVIDPAMLVYCGYIGGNWTDVGEGIAMDSSGAAYITGNTDSDTTTFPISVGPDLTYNGGSADVFVAKVKPDGSGLIYAGYIGGNGWDDGLSIAIDGSGAVYITGDTESDETTFPIKDGPGLTYKGGSGDAFIVKVNTDGSGLVYAGYLGGSGWDQGRSISIDVSGAAYITGVTESDESSFPVKGGPDLTYNGGIEDAFVAKVKPDGSDLVFAGYIGGSGMDVSNGIAVDSDGAAYITGGTASDQASFPVTGGPDLTYNGGYGDAFVVKVKPDGSGLAYAGYVGGSGSDEARGVAIDSGGAAYVTGYTSSDQSTFPISGGPDLTINSKTDAFVAKVKPVGSGLVYAGYIGGSHDEAGWGIAVDSTGAAYVTGDTESDQNSFPVVGGPDLTMDDDTYDNAFVAKVSPDGSRLVYAGYIEGSYDDIGRAIAVDNNGAAYVTGDTDSSQNSFPVIGGPDLTYNNEGDAFIAKIEVVTSTLVINYSNGSPGSYFNIIGTNYLPDQEVSVVVNGHVLIDDLYIDSSGYFSFLIDTTGADPGKYIVNITGAEDLRVGFVLDSSYPTRAQEGSGPVITLPTGIALTHSVYIPLVQH
jgi:hypothetical protein